MNREEVLEYFLKAGFGITQLPHLVKHFRYYIYIGKSGITVLPITEFANVDFGDFHACVGYELIKDEKALKQILNAFGLL
jgi:hypothetical protein